MSASRVKILEFEDINQRIALLEQKVCKPI